MGKLINAQSILKQKGYVQNKFDTNAFMESVGNYFMENSVESKLLLAPYRFLDVQWKQLTEQVEISLDNPYNLTHKDERRGFKPQWEKNDKGEYAFMREMFDNDFDKYKAQEERGLMFPRIIIDKPFYENAAATLRLMGGFVVEKQVKKHKKLYWVTLI